jgi:electron transport complex protein RnfE
VPSFFDGLGMGVGFLFGLCLIGAIREFFGAGQLFGFDVLGFKPLLVMILPAGGFFVIGFIMATFNYIEYKLTGKIPASGGGH